MSQAGALRSFIKSNKTDYMQYSDPYIEMCLEGPESVFNGLSQSDLETISKNKTLDHFMKGEIIAKEGNLNTGFLQLAAGKAKVFRIGAGGRAQIIRLLKPQNIIFIGSLFPETRYPFNVMALEDCMVVNFKKQVLTRIIRQNARLAFKLIKILSDEMQYSDRRLISLTQKHVRGRIAESLLLLRDTFGFEPDGRTLQLALNRDDLAHLSNMTTSNAIRTLSGFVSEGIIGIERRKILILDNDKLNEISNSGQ
jgi:CRP-like cAMP-binding protein